MNNNINKPNIFDYAPSELSQDAFICWLLKHADPDIDIKDEKMVKTAQYFLNSLFEISGKKLPGDLQNLEIRKQVEKIDVLVLVNDKNALIIEDKTNTKDHSDQLIGYLKKFENKYTEYKKDNILPIYFKTGDQSSYEDVKDKGYKVYKRNNFLNVLKYGIDLGISNRLFTDYYEYLLNIENEVNRYIDEPFYNWTDRSLIGLYKHLKEEINSDNCKWGYENNRSGGFMGFSWHVKNHNGFLTWLQLELKINNKVENFKNNLCFKIGVNDEAYDKNQIRDIIRKYHDIIKSHHISKDMERPGRLISKGNVTVYYIENAIKFNQDKKVDISKTMELMNRAEQYHNDFAQALPKIT